MIDPKIESTFFASLSLLNDFAKNYGVEIRGTIFLSEKAVKTPVQQDPQADADLKEEVYAYHFAYPFYKEEKKRQPYQH